MCTVYPAVVVKCTYIGETTRRLELKVNKHHDARKRGDEKVVVGCRETTRV